MKTLKLVLRAWLLGLLLLACGAWAQTTPRHLILYDAPPGVDQTKEGLGYAILLRNLLGHFDGTVDLVPVQNYVAGQLNNYTNTFYLGSYYDNQLPPSFLSDVVATNHTVVWFRYNLWQMAWDPAYNFQARFGFVFNGLRGLNAAPTSSRPTPGFFDTIHYKNLAFKKYYNYDPASGYADSDPDLGLTAVTDAAKARSVVNVSNSGTGEQAPYIMRSGNFWYFADLPLSYIGPRDRYLVLADILHDIVQQNHYEYHYAMVRLEDVGAMVSVTTMKTLSDYLHQRQIPFSIATIPLYKDPLGAYNGGVPQTVPLSQATNLRTALNYALARGGEIVMHGYTHQYSNVPNPLNAISGADYEFWDIVNNRPIPGDSTAWALGRYRAGLQDLNNAGYYPTAWETPHYQASAVDYRASTQVFPQTYQRAVYYTADQPSFYAPVERDFPMGQFFPYVIKRDYYGQRVVPENLGNVEYSTGNDAYTWQDIVTNAQYAKAVRDGFGSFFFHPFLLDPAFGVPGMADFQKIIDGITNLGYAWTVPSWLP